MKTPFLLALGALSCCIPARAQNPPAPRDLYSDTWVATDDLGRQMPVAPRPPQPGKTVGLFYYIANSTSQHFDLENSNHAHQTPNKLFDISKILAANPEKPTWGPIHQAHWWGEPLWGYYVNDDPWVIRRQLSMLADAGVDALFFDVTNAVTYRSAYIAICKVALQMRREGNKTPQFAFVTHAGAAETVTKLYQEFYRPKRYADLWFRWEGKPLMIGNRDATYSSDVAEWNVINRDDEYLPSPVGNWKKGDLLPTEIRDFFTWRTSWAWSDPNGWFGDGKEKWPWVDNSPQQPGLDASGKIEQIVVAPAQHPTTNKGRSHSGGVQPPIDKYGLTPVTDRGIYFAEQWKRALEVDAPFLWLTQWNEWTAMRFVASETNRPGFLGRRTDVGQSYFVDLYNREFTRDLEPMRGGSGDNYFMQMADGIRRFRGARPAPVDGGLQTIQLGDFAAWDKVKIEYRDTLGDNMTRDWPGWGGNRYQNNTGRNDIARAKVVCDAQNISFYVQTSQTLSPWSGGRWMQLLIDADQNPRTGWNGYDFCVNATPLSPTRTTVATWQNGAWKRAGNVNFVAQGNQLQIAVPRKMLGQNARVAFDFHWVDNAPTTGDIKAFYLDGDSAPNGRFNYRYQNRASAP